MAQKWLRTEVDRPVGRAVIGQDAFECIGERGAGEVLPRMEERLDPDGRQPIRGRQATAHRLGPASDPDDHQIPALVLAADGEGCGDAGGCRHDGVLEVSDDLWIGMVRTMPALHFGGPRVEPFLSRRGTAHRRCKQFPQHQVAGDRSEEFEPIPLPDKCRRGYPPGRAPTKSRGSGLTTARQAPWHPRQFSASGTPPPCRRSPVRSHTGLQAKA